jgi:four helix bundle protein
MARTFEELTCWKLARDLRESVFELTSKPTVAKDFRFCDQIRESARSAPRNIAEGFGRYYPSESIPFMRIATGSLHETLNHLLEAQQRKYLDETAFLAKKRLTLRAIKATTEFMKYLESPRGARFNRRRSAGRSINRGSEDS